MPNAVTKPKQTQNPIQEGDVFEKNGQTLTCLRVLGGNTYEMRRKTAFQAEVIWVGIGRGIGWADLGTWERRPTNPKAEG